MRKLDKKLKEVYAYWFPLAIIITLLCGLIYLVSQQSLRLSANSPQAEIAKNYSYELDKGTDPQFFVPKRQVDISRNQNFFIMIFDKNGNPLLSSALLDNKIPFLPKGVFDYAKVNGENRITWQPKPGVRSAIVIRYFDGANSGFILVGKSLTETEILEDKILLIVALGWIATLSISLLAVLFSLKLTAKI